MIKRWERINKIKSIREKDRKGQISTLDKLNKGIE